MNRLEMLRAECVNKRIPYKVRFNYETEDINSNVVKETVSIYFSDGTIFKTVLGDDWEWIYGSSK